LLPSSEFFLTFHSNRAENYDEDKNFQRTEKILQKFSIGYSDEKNCPKKPGATVPLNTGNIQICGSLEHVKLRTDGGETPVEFKYLSRLLFSALGY
jgi:hypothetical protein